MITKFKHYRIWLYLQATSLLAGNIVGWSTISKEVNTFCGQEGSGYWSLLTFRGTLTTNPLVTPCFWRSIVFVITLIWTINLILEKNTNKTVRSLNRLVYLLGGGTLFAFVNNLPVFYTFYTKSTASTLSCSADKVINPFTTSCFFGFIAFFAGFYF